MKTMTFYHGKAWRDRKAHHKIPLYYVDFTLVITGDIQRAHNRHKKILGEYEESGDTALSSCAGSDFFVFLQFGRVCHGHIAHEIFHATHRILEWCAHDFSPKCHEPSAYLCEYLTKLVYADLAKWKLRIKP